MPETEGPQERAQTAKIDLSQYRTADLAERLIELISVPGALRKIGKTTSLFSLLLAVSCALIFWYSEVTLAPSLVGCAYALVVGVVLGLLLSGLRVITTAMRNIESILRIILEITGKAALDYEHLQAGKKQMPTGGELVEQVYDEVVLPTLEKAVAGVFGFLGKPLLWTYYRTIGSAVRYLIQRVDRKQRTAENEQQLADAVTSDLGSIAKYSETIHAFTSRASEIVSNIGGTIRFYAMLPLYIVFLLSLFAATIPIFVIRYFGSG